MASTTKLTMTFVTEEGTTKTYSIQNVNPSATANNVKAITQRYVNLSSGSSAVIEPSLVLAKSASLVTTTDTPVDLDA